MLEFLVAEAGLDARAAYSTFNMGAGYALYCARGQRASGSSPSPTGSGSTAIVAGRVEEGPRQVILEPVGVRFDGEQLELSAEPRSASDLSLRLPHCRGAPRRLRGRRRWVQRPSCARPSAGAGATVQT